ncbi:MAG TPA: aminodeoxychorismate lyase [Steroidobacteraceae bacterium]|nr:aminodeoxychorismate lyase [Steroidobacteraceae bacterium]
MIRKQPARYDPGSVLPGAGSERMLVDGTEAAGVSTLDRGLHFGDGLFETIACRAGRPRFLSLHLERLMSGCKRLQIAFHDEAAVRSEVEELAHGSDRALVKVLVTRGSAVARGYGFTGREKATRITIRYAWPAEDSAPPHAGLKAGTLALRLGENPLLAGLKHCNRLEQVLARAECLNRGLSEGILFSSSGRLVSGTMTNVFLVRGSTLQTPLLDVCGVAGVMRRIVLRQAASAGIEAHECALDLADLRAADEVFLTNARVGIWPVRELDEQVLAPGALTHRLLEELTPLLEEPRDA